MKFKLTTKQAEFIGAVEQFTSYIGAIGTGKSTALIVKSLFHSQESPNNLGVIVRKNFTDLRDSTIKDFETYTGFKVSETKKECLLPNGSTILFRHGDELPVLKNLNLGFFGIEQAEEFGDETTWQFLKMRLRRDVKHRNGFIVGNTAGHNWVWQLFKRNGVLPNHRLIEAITQEHAHILPADYIENLKTLPKKLYARYVMNSWDETEGLIYDEYEATKHKVSPIDIPDTWERGFVLDHGFRNPTAILWYAIDYDGNVHLTDEHYEREKPISYHAEMIKHRGIMTGYCDPSIFNTVSIKAGKKYSIADEYAEFGVNLMPSTKQEEKAALARVNEFFKSGRIKVHDTLVHFEQEITNWKWKEVRPNAANLNLPEEPEDKDNHLMDCLKYLIVSRFSESERPKVKSEYGSLAYFEEQDKYNKELEKRRNGDKTW